MYADLREVAAYMPKASPFADLVKEIYGLSDLKKYRKPGISGISVMPPQRSPTSSMMAMRVDIPDSDNGKPPAVRKKNPVEDAVSDKAVVEVLSNLATKIKKVDKTDARAVFFVNVIVVKQREKAKSKGFSKFLISFLSATMAGLAVAYLTMASPAQNKEPELYSVSVDSGNLNIRNSPSIDPSNKNVVATARNGNLLRVIDEDGEFYEIDCVDVGLAAGSSRCFASKLHLRTVVSKNK